MKRGLKKRGLSPVIATGMLIALVLVLAAIVFLWAKSFIAEQIEKQGQPVQSICKDVDFYYELFPSLGSANVELDVKNKGNVPIYDFEVKQITESGDSVTSEFGIALNPGQATRQELSLAPDTTGVTLYPKVLGNVRGKQLNKPYTCADNSITKNL